MGRITTAKARELCQNYISDPSNDPNDANQTWFSIYDIKNFIADAELAGCTGIRIYLGKYDPNEAVNPGMTTVFITGTVRNEANDESDYTELNSLNFGHAGRPPRKNYPF
jgi:hypothetical protein